MKTLELGKAQHDQLPKSIMELLGIDQLGYNTLMYELGITYLELYLNDDDGLIRDFSTFKGFWNWWKIQYQLIDDVFVKKFSGADCSDRMVHNKLNDAYIEMHCSIEKHIDKVVYEKLQENRDRMTEDLVESKTRLWTGAKKRT